MLDDTSYFLPCETTDQADYLALILNSHAAQSFYNSFVFWDATRPITAELLCRLELRLLARELGSEQTFTNYFPTAPDKKHARKRPASATSLALFPD